MAHRILAGLAILSALVSVKAVPIVSTPTTTVFSEPTDLPSPYAISHTNVTEHGPFTGVATTTGAISTNILAPSIEPAPPPPQIVEYPSDGQLHGDQPMPFTPSGGIGTNGSLPLYKVATDFDYQSIALALYHEWIELDLFHWGLATFSEEEFDAYGINAEDRHLLQHMADQEIGHASVLAPVRQSSAPTTTQCPTCGSTSTSTRSSLAGQRPVSTASSLTSTQDRLPRCSSRASRSKHASRWCSANLGACFPCRNGTLQGFLRAGLGLS